MVLAINTKTGIIRDMPLNVINHKVLGKHLEVYTEIYDEVEEDKVVIDKKVLRRKKVEEIALADEAVLDAHERIASAPESFTGADDLP